MTSTKVADLKTRATAALAGINGLEVYEVSYISFDAKMAVSPIYVEVRFRPSECGPIPSHRMAPIARLEWKRYYRELSAPAIAAAKIALRKRRIIFREVAGDHGTTKLVITSK